MESIKGQQSEEEKRKEASKKLLKDIIGGNLCEFAGDSKFAGKGLINLVTVGVQNSLMKTISECRDEIRKDLKDLPKDLEIDKVDKITGEYLDKWLDKWFTKVSDAMQSGIAANMSMLFLNVSDVFAGEDIPRTNLHFLVKYFLRTDAGKKFLKGLIFRCAKGEDFKKETKIKIGKGVKDSVRSIICLMELVGDFLSTDIIFKKFGFTQKDLLELAQKDQTYKCDRMSLFMSLYNDLEDLEKAKANCEKLKTYARSMYNEKVDAKKETEMFKKKLGEVQAELNELKGKDACLSKTSKANEEMSKKNEEFLDEKKKLLDEIERLRNENKTLKDENIALKENKADLENKNKNYGKDIEKLKNILSESEEKSKGKDIEIKNLIEENKKLKEQVDYLVSEREKTRQMLVDQVCYFANFMIGGIDTAFKSQSGIVENKSSINSNTQNYIYSGWSNEEQNYIKSDISDIENISSGGNKNYVLKSSLKVKSESANCNNNNEINFGCGGKQNSLDEDGKNKQK